MKGGTDVTGLLSDLVAIPSINPMGRPSDGDRFREQQIAGYVAEYMRSSGMDVSVSDVAPGRPNVIGYVDAGAAETILLEAHLDTVHVDNMAIEPFTPVVRDGRLYGRGACDTKGSLAAFLAAVTDCLATPKRLKYNVVVAAVADEEYQFTGARHAVEAGLKADAGIVGEPTRLRIVRAHKGLVRWRIITHGVAAHSAFPERGRNAIYVMGQVLTRIERYARRLAEREGHALLGPRTLSVGVIEGGSAVNIVPDGCSIEIDRRALPGEQADEILDDVRTQLRDINDWEFSPPHVAIMGMEVPEDAPVVRRLAAAVHAMTGDVMVETAPYMTNASVYNAAGIPTVVFGPGDIARAHTDSEFIPLDELNTAVTIIRNVLCS